MESKFNKLFKDIITEWKEVNPDILYSRQLDAYLAQEQLNDKLIDAQQEIWEEFQKWTKTQTKDTILETVKGKIYQYYDQEEWKALTDDKKISQIIYYTVVNDDYSLGDAWEFLQEHSYNGRNYQLTQDMSDKDIQQIKNQFVNELGLGELF